MNMLDFRGLEAVRPGRPAAIDLDTRRNYGARPTPMGLETKAGYQVTPRHQD